MRLEERVWEVSWESRESIRNAKDFKEEKRREKVTNGHQARLLNTLDQLVAGGDNVTEGWVSWGCVLAQSKLSGANAKNARICLINEKKLEEAGTREKRRIRRVKWDINSL